MVQLLLRSTTFIEVGDPVRTDHTDKWTSWLQLFCPWRALRDEEVKFNHQNFILPFFIWYTEFTSILAPRGVCLLSDKTLLLFIFLPYLSPLSYTE